MTLVNLVDSISDGISKVKESVSEFAGDVVHGIRLGDPQYSKGVKELQESAGLIAVVGLVAGCAAVAFGALTVATGSLGLLVLTGVAIWISYNSFIIKGNVDKIAKQPARYLKGYGTANGVDETLLSDTLSKGTFACTIPVNFFVWGLDFLMQDTKTQKKKVNELNDKVENKFIKIEEEFKYNYDKYLRESI